MEQLKLDFKVKSTKENFHPGNVPDVKKADKDSPFHLIISASILMIS